MYELPDSLGTCPVCRRSWQRTDGTSAVTVSVEPTGEEQEVSGKTLPVMIAKSLRCPYCGTEWRTE